MRKIIATLLLLSTIKASLAASPPHLYTVIVKPITQTLYFNGTIEPIASIPVISPTTGVIDQKYFIYGQIVKEGQKLFHVQTDQLLDNLWSAKVDYLNAASDYNKLKNWQASTDMMTAQSTYDRAQRSYSQDQNTYQQNQELYKLGIISAQELLNSKNTAEDSKESLAEAKLSLQQTMNQGQGDAFIIGQLKLKSAEQKFKSLESQYHATTILAPATGIALEINNNAALNNTKDNNKVDVSSNIIYQQALFNIGDLSGIKISVNVPEININQIKNGQSATITGSGFPNLSLQGHVTNIASQANADTSSVPTFPVVIVVDSITDQERQQIRSGMDAEVALNIYNESQAISVPISAVGQNSQGQSFVEVYNPQTKESTKSIVTTSVVSNNQVQITSGLIAGQQIILP